MGALAKTASVCALLATLLALPALGTAGGPTQCPKKHLCVWADPDYDGQMVKLGKAGLSDKIYEQMNDEASSVKNRRQQSSILYTDVSGGGASLCLAPGHKYPDLSEQTIDDTVSSSRLHRHSAVC